MILTPYEEAKKNEILSSERYDYLSDLEETWEGSRSYHYKVVPSNIGDEVFLVFKGQEFYISDPDSF